VRPWRCLRATARARRRVQESRWFRRGWTLQELIAPRRVEFYSAEWESIGTKAGLSGLLAERTKIPIEVLQGGALSKWPASIRMSWACGRFTTRKEDEAYCLLGIFDVHMPLLYGEGARAFIRLQEEILRRSEDMSLLLWTSFGLSSTTGWYGVLAPNTWSVSEGAPSLYDYAAMVCICAPNGSQVYVDRAAYGTLQITYQMDVLQRFPPATVTSRGILATLLMRPVMIEIHGNTPTPEPEPIAFAWVLAMQSVMVGDPPSPKPYMIGLPLVFLHGSGDNSISLESVLGEQDKPLVAARRDAGTLLLLDADYMESLVPRQVYLTATHKEYYYRNSRDDSSIGGDYRPARLFVGSDTLGIHNAYVCEKNPRIRVGTWDRWVPFRNADIWSPSDDWSDTFGKADNARSFSFVGVLPLRAHCRSGHLTDNDAVISDVAVGMATSASATHVSLDVKPCSYTLFITAQTWTWAGVQTDNDIHAAYINDDGNRYADRAYVRLKCGHLAVLTAKWDYEDTMKLGHDWSWRHAVLEISFP
jgi:hypothetical protein